MLLLGKDVLEPLHRALLLQRKEVIEVRESQRSQATTRPGPRHRFGRGDDQGARVGGLGWLHLALARRQS